MCAWHNSAVRADDAAGGAAVRRALGLLLEGAAINFVQPDPEAYARMRSAILRNSIRLAEPLSEANLLLAVQAILREFDAYRSHTEETIEGRRKEWRHVVAMLSQRLLEQGNFKPESEEWRVAKAALASAVTAEEIQSLRDQLQRTFLRTGAEATAREAKLTEEQDRSVANDNAAGLRGGGAAIEHVRTMIAKSRPGYIGLFRLSCLDVVGERFGQEGIQDCLMAVSAFLIENLRAEDSVYHWSESSLLAVCDRKIREDILSAELNRVLQRNRDFTIQIAGSTIMLRIPIELELFPIDVFQSADDLQKIPSKRGRGDRGLSEKAAARLYS
jgi:GGDEF domain-containing protein